MGGDGLCPVPIGQWLKGEEREFARRVLLEAQTEEWIDRTAALDLLRRFGAGRPDVTWRQVWVLVVFSLWHQIYVERVYDRWRSAGNSNPRPARHPGRPEPSGARAG